MIGWYLDSIATPRIGQDVWSKREPSAEWLRMAKNGLDGTPIKRQFARLRVYFIWGTSAAAPFFAGMMALVDQQTASQQGHADYGLYKLAHSESLSQCNGSATSGLSASTCIFNDVTSGNNAVPGEVGSSYQSTVGYDFASGLGPVNVPI
jgi:subtilase family serine protease